MNAEEQRGHIHIKTKMREVNATLTDNHFVSCTPVADGTRFLFRIHNKGKTYCFVMEHEISTGRRCYIDFIHSCFRRNTLG